MFALYFRSVTCDSQHFIDSIHLVCPLSDVVLQCVCVIPVCDCFLAAAVWEPLIVDVPLQGHQPLHHFPPVGDSKIFRTFCKTRL